VAQLTSITKALMNNISMLRYAFFLVKDFEYLQEVFHILMKYPVTECIRRKFDERLYFYQ